MLDEENGLYYMKDSVIDLAPLEVKLMKLLIDEKGKIAKYENLNEKLYKGDSEKARNCLRQIVFGLNQKLKRELKISCRVSMGYRLEYGGRK